MAVTSGRGLVKVTVEGAKDPIEAGNFHGHAKARIRGILHDVGSEVRLADAGDQSKPRGRCEFVVQEGFREPSGYANRGCGEVGTAVGEYDYRSSCTDAGRIRRRRLEDRFSRSLR